jgi:hypothetical protein
MLQHIVSGLGTDEGRAKLAKVQQLAQLAEEVAPSFRPPVMSALT